MLQGKVHLNGDAKLGNSKGRLEAFICMLVQNTDMDYLDRT